jgi:hypothetical protein
MGRGWHGERWQSERNTCLKTRHYKSEDAGLKPGAHENLESAGLREEAEETDDEVGGVRARPDGIRDGSVHYTSLRLLHPPAKFYARCTTSNFAPRTE